MNNEIIKLDKYKNHNTLYDINYNFYDKFHKNKINKMLHIIGIPMIVWSSFLATHGIKIMKTRLSTILFSIYSIYYIKLNKFVGILSTLFYYLIYNNSLNLYKQIMNDKNNKNKKTVLVKYVLFTQLFAWLLQLYGHKYHENNFPALISGFTQSITIAPLFSIEHLSSYFVKIFIMTMVKYS